MLYFFHFRIIFVVLLQTRLIKALNRPVWPHFDLIISTLYFDWTFAKHAFLARLPHTSLLDCSSVFPLYHPYFNRSCLLVYSVLTNLWSFLEPLRMICELRRNKADTVAMRRRRPRRTIGRASLRMRSPSPSLAPWARTVMCDGLWIMDGWVDRLGWGCAVRKEDSKRNATHKKANFN